MKDYLELKKQYDKQMLKSNAKLTHTVNECVNRLKQRIQSKKQRVHDKIIRITEQRARVAKFKGIYQLQEEIERVNNESEEQQYEVNKQISETEENVKRVQKLLTKQLYLCYNHQADQAIQLATQQATQEENDIDDFEMIEKDDFSNDEEYKEYEERHKKSNELGQSTYGILEGKILFQSNYFGDKSVSNDDSVKKGAKIDSFNDNLSEEDKNMVDKKVEFVVSDHD